MEMKVAGKCRASFAGWLGSGDLKGGFSLCTHAQKTKHHCSGRGAHQVSLYGAMMMASNCQIHTKNSGVPDYSTAKLVVVCG